MTTLTLGAVEAIGATKKDGQGAKNMFALGLLSWMYGRSSRPARPSSGRSSPASQSRRGQRARAEAGWNYGETTEAFAVTYEVARPS